MKIALSISPLKKNAFKNKLTLYISISQKKESVIQKWHNPLWGKMGLLRKPEPLKAVIAYALKSIFI